MDADHAPTAEPPDTSPPANVGASQLAWALVLVRLVAVVLIAATLWVMLERKLGLRDPTVPGLGASLMGFNTALGLCLSGLSLLLSSTPCRSSGMTAWVRDASLLAAGLVGTLATLTIMEMLTGSALGIDNLFVMHVQGADGIAARGTGQMSQPTALALLLLSVALGLCTTCGLRPSLKWASMLCAIAATSVGIAAGGVMLLAEGSMSTVPLFAAMDQRHLRPLSCWVVESSWSNWSASDLA